MAKKIFNLAREVKASAGVKLSMIDLGGGIGLPSSATDSTATFERYASSALKDHLKTLEELGNPTLVFEPGRALVADAGILLTRVNVLKRQGDVSWAIVDAGMNTFLRPALYQAKHEILLANREAPNAQAYSVGGPCCESGDVFAKGISLPPLKENDLLAVLDVGAYGFTMTSNYNALPRPAVVLVSRGEVFLIRRRETYEEMVAGEAVPKHLRI
jgi:diaminopimelate decarboxylase